MTASDPDRKESDAAQMFEEPHFATLGVCYEKRPRFSGGAYQPIVKRCEEFFDKPLKEALPMREARANQLLQVDDLVAERVAALKAKGFDSPYIKAFVVARSNPIRFSKTPHHDYAATLEKMIASLQKMDLEKVKREDVARAGGYGGGGDEE